jgi:hypothetical protein
MAGTVGAGAGVLGPEAMTELRLARKDGGSAVAGAGDGDEPAVEDGAAVALGAAGDCVGRC